MAITEESRFQLHQRLNETLGEKEALTLMEHLPPVGWADLATKQDLQNGIGEVRAEFADLRAEMADLRAEMHQGFAHHRELFTKDIEHVREETAQLRTEMRHGFEAIYKVMEHNRNELRSYVDASTAGLGATIADVSASVHKALRAQMVVYTTVVAAIVTALRVWA